MRSANNDLQNTIRIRAQYCRTSILREALVQPVHCDLRRLKCKSTKELQHTTVHPRLDAAVPMHKVSQNMQNTIAQHQQRTEKITWNHQLHCLHFEKKTRKAATPETIAQAGQLFSAAEPPFTRKKHNVSCKSQHSSRIHDPSVPMRSAKDDLRNTIRIRRPYCRAAYLANTLLYCTRPRPVSLLYYLYSSYRANATLLYSS